MIRLRAAVAPNSRLSAAAPTVGPLDLEVAPGSATALIGPNGAGKSLLLALVAGTVRAVSGSVDVVGRVGYAPASLGESPAVRCDELLEFLAIEAGVQGRGRREAVGRALTMAGLAGRPGERVDQLSDGGRTRLLIAAALLGDPEVIVLDDPMRSLDPAGRADVERLVEDAALAGRCVLAALNDARIGGCWTDIAVMRSGRIERTLPAGGPWTATTPVRGEDLLGGS
jgi:ABC-2 type transport system ATP-binding protein